MSDAQLVRERRGPVVVARLNRPDQCNALTPEIMRGLGEVISEAESTPDVRVLVLTGTGDRAFCAGMDLKAFAAGDAVDLGSDEVREAFFRLLEARVRVPLVGAANATALAGGFELLLGCDLVVVSSEAQLGLPEVKRGLFPAGGGTFLGTRIPLAVALEMTLTGDPISAARGYELGLVNAVVAPDEVLGTALAMAERIAANGPLAVAATKELVRLSVADAAGARARLAELQPVIFASDDAKEGATAFIEKRTPVWRGR